MNKIELSIKNEIKMLNSIINNSFKSKIPLESIIFSLKNQTNFSRFNNFDLKILSYSLNSHKSYIEKYSNLSFNEFNNLRKEALTSITHSNIKSKTKKEDNNKVKNEIISKLNRQNILLISFLHMMKDKMEVYAYTSSKPELINDFNFFLKEFEQIINPLLSKE